jgi:hypothetical protein
MRTTTGMCGTTAVRHHCRAPHPCVHSPSHMPLSSPPARDDGLRRSPTLPLDAAQLSSYHHWPVRRPRWLFLVGGAAFFFCLRTTTVDASPLRLPGLHSTMSTPTPDAPPARHSTSSASKSPRGYRRALVTSLRGATICRSAVQHLPPPFLRLVSLRLAGA